MKLRNKRTGEIVEWEQPISYKVGKKYYSLAELSADWEDYEEPKEDWYLNSFGKPIKMVFGDDDFRQALEAIGNHFETEEEAEKAVEKLKTWKQLKDKGLRIASVEVVEEPYNGLGQDVFRVEFVVDDLRGHRYRALDYESDKDLNTCFGGEE